jgi:hypothetical protein
MSTGVIVGIIVAVIVVAAIVVASAELRRARMRRQFGPEYDRLVKEMGEREARAELSARWRRADKLGIHPLAPEQQARYAGDWAAVQERFVDSPAEALTEARALVWDVMKDRGYPASDTEASVEALSVYHARALDGYRQATETGDRAESASTEELREALIRYRALVAGLLGAPVDSFSSRGREVAEPGAADTSRTADMSTQEG